MTIIEAATQAQTTIDQLTVRVASLASELATLTADQTGQLTASQMAALTTKQMSAFTPEQIRSIAPSSMPGLTRANLTGMTPAQMSGFSPTQVEKFNAIQTRLLTPTQFGAFSAGSVKGLSVEGGVMARLTAAQVTALGREKLYLARWLFKLVVGIGIFRGCVYRIHWLTRHIWCIYHWHYHWRFGACNRENEGYCKPICDEYFCALIFHFDWVQGKFLRPF